MTDKEKIIKAIAIAIEYGGFDGEHHKDWVIDQMVHILAGDEVYQEIIEKYSNSWNKGIAP